MFTEFKSTQDSTLETRIQSGTNTSVLREVSLCDVCVLNPQAVNSQNDNYGTSPHTGIGKSRVLYLPFQDTSH